MPRKEFELTDAELAELLAASGPTLVMYLSGGKPLFDSPQENANRAWEKLGKKHGFDSTSARPVPGKGDKYFTAEVQPTEREHDA